MHAWLYHLYYFHVGFADAICIQVILLEWKVRTANVIQIVAL